MAHRVTSVSVPRPGALLSWAVWVRSLPPRQERTFQGRVWRQPTSQETKEPFEIPQVLGEPNPGPGPCNSSGSRFPEGLPRVGSFTLAGGGKQEFCVCLRCSAGNRRPQEPHITTQCRRPPKALALTPFRSPAHRGREGAERGGPECGVVGEEAEPEPGLSYPQACALPFYKNSSTETSFKYPGNSLVLSVQFSDFEEIYRVVQP